MINLFNGTGSPINLGQLIAKERTSENNAPANGLNKAEQSLVDQVSLSDETTKNLESLKNIDKQLTRFLDVLKGHRSAKSVLNEIDSEQGSFFVSQTKNALNFSQIQSIKETISLTTDIQDDGSLDLILSQTRETLSQTSLSLSTQQSFIFGTF